MPDSQLVRFWSQLKTTGKRVRNPNLRHLILPLLWSSTRIGSLNMLARFFFSMLWIIELNVIFFLLKLCKCCRIKVSRMMVGGMKVVGIYVWASEAAFKNSTMVLCQVFYFIFASFLLKVWPVFVFENFIIVFTNLWS